ncbi:MAG: beta-lactamase family protein [Lachnospiraceae bacterium]|nr:beta-lactamase family protein [Lachnospiraceae bacterium]
MPGIKLPEAAQIAADETCRVDTKESEELSVITRDKKVLDEYLEKRIREKKLSGVSVAVRGPEGVLFEGGYGVRDVAMSCAPDENTIMGIASMGKSMAALSCAILAAEGKLSLDDPVSKYIPAFRVPGNPKDAVTIRHLAMHTAGIPPMEPLEWSIAMNTPGRTSDWDLEMQRTSPNQMDTIEQIIDYIANCPYPSLGGPGEYMSYSNEGYAILCYVVDAAAGMSLEEFLDERIFTPLGMTRSTLDTDASRARAIAADGNITALFEANADGTLAVDEQWSILPPFRACACVKSTAHDMARYYQCLSNGGVLDGEQVLPAKAAELMIGSAFPEQKRAFYCLGLNKRVEDGHVFCEHSGGLHGVSSEGGLIKGENYGFAVLCNEGDCDPTDILWTLYNWVLGYPLEQEHYWLDPAGCEFSEPEMLMGSYICHEGIPVIAKVYLEDGRLMVKKGDVVSRMVFCGETWFILVNEEGKRTGRMHFWIRDGKAWGVQVYTRIYQRMEEE